MRCERCDQADRHPVRRAKLAERDHKVAVVLDVPMGECPACGDRWLRWQVAGRLDELFSEMLVSDIEVATRHFDGNHTAA
ncbi:MAG: YgiT-type zinc finger protein [Ilumatobacteraceae bacterium]